MRLPELFEGQGSRRGIVDSFRVSVSVSVSVFCERAWALG